MRIVPGDRTSEFSTASWDEALSFVVSKITELRAADGPDAIGCFGGGGLTNEKAYAFGKFARVALRTLDDRLQRTFLYVLGRDGGESSVRN
jgi:assimilatory nitrate reductase catalytic subunit